MGDQSIKKLSQRIVELRGRLFLICLLATVIITAGALRSSFDSSIAALLTRSDPYLEELRTVEREFPEAEQIVFALLGDAGTVFDSAVLDALADLRINYRKIPHVARISTLLDYQSPEQELPLFQRHHAEYSAQQLREIEAAALQDRLLSGTLLSPDAELTFASITMEPEGLGDNERLQVADEILALLDELRQRHPGIQVHVNSDVLYEAASRDAMISDLTRLMPIVILVCVLAICFCFRSIRFGICILAQALATVAATIGTIGLLGISFNSISIIAPLVVVIIAVADSVHIISIYRQQLLLNRGGVDGPVEAMAQSVRYNFRAITLTTVTTAIGFSSLTLSSSPAINDFGLIVATGIFYAWITTLMLLPALLIRVCPTTGGSPDASGPIHRTLARIHFLLDTRERELFGLFSLLSLATLLLLPLNKTDFNRLDFIAAGSDLLEYYNVVDEHLNRGASLTYAIDSGEIDGAITPQFLQRVDGFSQWLQQREDVESVASLVDVVKTIHRFQNEQQSEYYVIPDDIDTIATHLNDYELVQQPEFALDNFIDRGFSILPLFVNAVPASNQGIIDLDSAITSRFSEYFPDAELLHGSSLLLFARMDELVTVELLQGYALSLVLITLTLIIGFRSISLGLLSVFPNVLPATMVFGLWGLFVGQLDPFVMMLFSISIGLVVDDTVHILSHFDDRRRRAAGTLTAIKDSLSRAGPALMITTLVLALGTLILIGAETLYFRQAARLLVPIVILALVLDMLYLPSILVRFDRLRERLAGQ
ncbi:MAG: MMPL family transporter [Pseudohongiellaceae bacterium]